MLDFGRQAFGSQGVFHHVSTESLCCSHPVTHLRTCAYFSTFDRLISCIYGELIISLFFGFNHSSRDQGVLPDNRGLLPYNSSSTLKKIEVLIINELQMIKKLLPQHFCDF